MTKSKLSIITAVYCDIPEKVDWLIEAIESVRAQTLTDWEMILIDDKSPTEPTEAKFKYADDSRIRWFENATNEGPAKTRNTAVALSDSECIMALDSDDLLAGPDVLSQMYDAWSMDQTKIIYGNLQMYTLGSGGVFERGKVIQLGNYTFELAMNLNGIMPVTAMHSKQCHIDTGGWQPELAEGLEDVEKWIMAGKRGYCGLKINTVSLIYRRQEQSRAYNLKFVSKKFEAMQQKIRVMHADVYAGRFPMACCGKGGATTAPALDPVVMSQQVKVGKIVPLDGYEEKDLEWVKYIGGKTGRHDIVIRTGPQKSYTIFGTGQVFQIHRKHHGNFESMQRYGFEMNQPDPRNREPDPEPVAVERPPEITVVRPPQLSTILRLDSKAAQTVRADVQPGPADYAQAERDYLDRMEKAKAMQADSATNYMLSDLDLSPRVTDTLAQDSARLWTVEKLARTTPQLLAAYPGIGIVGANKIIALAKELVGG